MLFSSLIFLYYFLPLTLLGYYLLINSQFRNFFLLLASLIFFAWGGVSFTFVLLGSIIINYFFGLLTEKYRETKKGIFVLWCGVGVNLLLLVIFKYLNFLIENINELNHFFELPLVHQTKIALPVGISFYTFHSLSYLVDIYKRKSVAQKNFIDLSLYITMFSQLIAGPIIRYADISKQLKERNHTLTKFRSGIERFLIGLGKKVLLANTFAFVADEIFATNIENLSALNAWLGITCYSLQIYLDFSGYSDMAIGLGRMFGFEFMENFNFPYIAKSIRDFWHRWHISLSTFFRDYVYIPLGGSRVKNSKVYFNLLIVFFLTGFWHGASWTFVLWGLLHGLFIVLEKIGLDKILKKIWPPIANLYTILIVMFAWVLFRADSLIYALGYWKAMFNFNLSDLQKEFFYSYTATPDFLLAFSIAVLGSLGFFELLKKRSDTFLQNEKSTFKTYAYSYHLASAFFYVSIIVLCTLYLNAGSYNPFIYYRF